MLVVSELGYESSSDPSDTEDLEEAVDVDIVRHAAVSLVSTNTSVGRGLAGVSGM